MVARDNIDKLKALFEQQRAETLSAIGRLEQEARSQTGNEPEDVGDRSVSNFSKELLFQQVATNRDRLRKLDSALRRIQVGSFGVCSTCGKEIAIKRLQAMPWTEYCRDCQEQLESHQRKHLEDIV